MAIFYPMSCFTVFSLETKKHEEKRRQTMFKVNTSTEQLILKQRLTK